jgi:putative PIN family toxin of toxin-antitoxin system
LKVLIDTNVWIAALVAHGFSKEIVDYCLSRHSVWTSEFILEETGEKLRRKFGLSAGTVRETMAFLRRNCQVFDDPQLPAPRVCRDRDDDRVLAAAAAIPADAILTGDLDLLVLKEYQGISILSPRDFWRREGLRS